MNREIQPSVVTVPPLQGRRPFAGEKLRVVRFEVLIVGTMSPAVSWMEARRVKRGHPAIARAVPF